MIQQLLLIGCGKMGSALLAGFKDASHTEITVIDPSTPAICYDNVSYLGHVSELPQGITFDVVIVAVKPQIIAQALPEYLAVVNTSTVIVSIVAGKSLTFFEDLFPSHAVIRTMPNLPVTVGQGATVAVANSKISSDQKSRVNALLSTTGKVFWEKDEQVMDAVTALSGSGPAYIFHFIECLMHAGEQLGLSAELSKSLAYQTALGSVLLANDSPHSVAQLREQVTSPNGTTAAALDVFMESRALEDLCLKAMAAAKRRSIELA